MKSSVPLNMLFATIFFNHMQASQQKYNNDPTINIHRSEAMVALRSGVADYIDSRDSHDIADPKAIHQSGDMAKSTFASAKVTPLDLDKIKDCCVSPAKVRTRSRSFDDDDKDYKNPYAQNSSAPTTKRETATCLYDEMDYASPYEYKGEKATKDDDKK